PSRSARRPSPSTSAPRRSGSASPSRAPTDRSASSSSIYTPLQGAPVIGEAIRLLDPDPAQVRFTMAGRGQDLARTRDLAGDSPAVEWFDWVERDELPALVFEH